MPPATIERLLKSQPFAVFASVLLTLPYWSSGIMKLVDFSAAAGETRHFGLEPAGVFAASIILVQIIGSGLIILGRMAWLGAGALGVFTAIATLVAHPFWTNADPLVRFHERNTFFEHAGLIGGLMLAAILRARRV
jgi:transmembrane protein